MPKSVILVNVSMQPYDVISAIPHAMNFTQRL
jgi:hypothetical protein